MREFVSAHAPTFAAFAVMVLVFVAFAAGIGPSVDTPPVRIPATPAQVIDLPGPGEDRDNDTYADDVDLWEGDLVLVLDVKRLSIARGPVGRPYLLVGTQDDHWRTGEEAELAWRRVVDHDPLGHSPGSADWIRTSLRTGTWWRSVAMEGEEHAIGRGGVLDEARSEDLERRGVTWPQEFVVNVRDDSERVRVDVEAWDAGVRPHERRASWVFEVDVPAGMWRQAGGPWWESGETVPFGAFSPNQAGIELELSLESDLSWETKHELADRWAPLLRFSEDERFFPTRADTMEEFHGFVSREGDYRTWTRSFDNGRHGYRLLLADFIGDGTTDHQDAAVLYDLLRRAEVAADTVYANVMRTTLGHVVVQYWFLYMYNFVLDETGREIRQLAHAGDREFMQLVFEDEEAAREGLPMRVAYSQHYEGVVTEYEEGEAPFHEDPERPVVFVALGSHASYPAAGTDDAFRHWVQGFGDTFFGDGEEWTPEDYDVEVLGPQSWHAGYLWGPATRHSRDMGTTARPLLQYGFSYPFVDPLHWEASLPRMDAEDLEDLYGGAP